MTSLPWKNECLEDGGAVTCRNGSYPVSALVRFVMGEARRRRVSGADLEDVCNDALLELLRRSPNIDDPFAYLGTILRRLCARLRSAIAAQRASEVDIDRLAESMSSASCKATLLSRKRALLALPPVDRGILLGWAQGYTDREMAGATGLEPGAIRVRVHRLRKQLLALS